MAEFDQYIGTKANNGTPKINPSMTIEGVSMTNNINRVGVGYGRFVGTISNGSHPLIDEIRTYVNKTYGAKPKEIKTKLTTKPQSKEGGNGK